MSHRRKLGQSWEKAARAYLDGEYINVIIPAGLGEVIGCSPEKAGHILRSLGWYPQRDRNINRNIYFRINPNRRVRF